MSVWLSALGLKQDLSNLNAVSPKLLEAWVRQDANNLVESAHLFISLLEVVQQKRAVECKLNKIRCLNAHSVESIGENVEAVSNVEEAQVQEKASPLIEDEEEEEEDWEEEIEVE